MSYTETKSFIKPVRDTANSHPYEIEFTSNTDNGGRVIIAVDERYLTFELADLERMIKVARASVELVI